MRLEVLLFASLADEAGQPSVVLDVPDRITVAELAHRLEERFPELQDRLQRVRIAVDHEFGRPEDTIPPGAEIAVIPPVSGGNRRGDP